MKIFFYIHHLGNGGAERVTSVLANEMAKQGHSVGIGLQNERNNAYTIDHRIELFVNSPKGSGISRRVKKYTALRKIIKQWNPDVIIAVMPYNFVAVKIATIGLHIPIVVSDHTNFTWNANWKLKCIRYYFYRCADAVAVLSQFDYNLMSSRLKNAVVMYNPLSFPVIEGSRERNRIVLAVGRLSVWHVKGFDRLINIWAEVAHNYPEWKLGIAGDGSKDDFDYLKKLAKENNVEDRIEFLGFCDNIKDVMSEASVFALTSRIEGFPCSLMEAMSQGCAPIAFGIQGIIKEIITDGEDGFIVPDGNLKIFKEKLSLLIEDDELRNEISRHAVVNIRRFEVDKVVSNWISFLGKLTRE